MCVGILYFSCIDSFKNMNALCVYVYSTGMSKGLG